jgi:hypothetical protein
VTIGSFTATTPGSSIGPIPKPFRFNVGAGAGGLDDIVIQLNGDNPVGGGDSSPIVHSIDIGYQMRASVAVSN